MLDTNRMFTLREVATHGSITAAAEALGYTTSAVSQQIAKLEKEAGQPLLERHARGVALTDAGRSVVRHTERILVELHAADAELAEIRGLRAGVLAIGTFPTAGSSLLPLVVKEFKTRHPGVELKVFSGRFDRLVDALRRRETELSLLWDYEWNRINDPTLTYHHLMNDPTMLLVSEHHRLADRDAISIGELRDESWVVRAEDHPVAQTLEKLCQQGGFTPRTSVFAHDYGEVQAMVAVQLGVAIAPRLAVLNPRPDVRSIRLATRPPQRRILIAHLAERRLSPAAHEAIAVSAAAARQLEEGFAAG
ncbi:LysR family transcriptional regulator [Mycolicibacterium fluoranthenivorans]|uniref:Probable hydrogen peroxide-inducible genes activator n=2 Tax=Mycolicibacterium TaxID=1866885 RepID=A0A7G8PCP5_9MYCO|nr:MULTISPECIES: LysR family transcriptional regulator [Mycolicibacterium]MCV7212384.1 LysR family transcriptional regulator [Mycolicibacterium canariasense]ORV15542.1 LysR family transcriptional regulator [Mycolicibacterium canariasense]QNJ92111.1 LysR family transcriptional regulator [Mycolicibacterium fluoranthenivorans]GAS98043.1 LysR family transcriptional regulator [Mycolicibacterium canariasense]